MPVNGGAGNAISLSEVQTFYGGSNPISMSEYYRGGAEVPSTSSSTVSMSLTTANGPTVNWRSFTWPQGGTLDFSVSVTGGNSVSPSTISCSVLPSGVSSTTAVSNGATTNFGSGTFTSDGVSFRRSTNTFHDSPSDTTTYTFSGSPSSGGTVYVYGLAGGANTMSLSNSSTTTTATDTNTNVPASGTINMDIFNAPGTATP